MAAAATSIPNTGASVTLASMALNEGTYLVDAKMWLSNAQTATAKAHYVKCSLVAQDTGGTIVDSDSTTVTVVTGQAGISGATALPFVVANVFPTPVTITLNCMRLDTNPGSTSAFDIKLTAAVVSTIVTQ